jgi:hypothetical protein
MPRSSIWITCWMSTMQSCRTSGTILGGWPWLTDALHSDDAIMALDMAVICGMRTAFQKAVQQAHDQALKATEVGASTSDAKALYKEPCSEQVRKALDEMAKLRGGRLIGVKRPHVQGSLR